MKWFIKTIPFLLFGFLFLINFSFLTNNKVLNTDVKASTPDETCQQFNECANNCRNLEETQIAYCYANLSWNSTFLRDCIDTAVENGVSCLDWCEGNYPCNE